MKSDNRSYILKTDGGKLSQALCQLCAEGEFGESLLRSGVNQASFCLFLAKIAVAHAAKGRSAEQIAEVFNLISGANASAAKQALNDLSIHWEIVNKDGESVLGPKTGEPTFEEKAQSVGAYWAKSGGSKPALNLSILNLG